jgi:serine/threonine-protein kinase
MSVLANGTLIDNRYTVNGRIGSGGMADVYLCDDQHLGRPVALKVMHDRFAQDQDFVRRFEREAQAAAGLQHRNVVNVFDRGQVGNTYYIAMEYLQGRSLKDVINAMGALDPKLAIHICLQILAAAKFAHAKGIVHRDIKPQNVMIDDEWNVKVTDFGIAHNPVAGDITQTGQMVGTAQYISPEQAQGKPVSNASDLYSVGTVLFEMLTGKVPFDGESSVSIALKHISEPPPRPSLVNASVPASLDAIVLKAMAKSPVERYASADEFSSALERARDGLGAAPGKTEIRSAVPVTAVAALTPEELEKKKRRRNWIIAGCVVAALLIAAAAYFLLVGSKEVVPNVVGRAVGDAQSRIAATGFKSQVFTQTNKAPSGEVFGQSPAGSTKARKGATIILNVSSGPGQVSMPDVEGLSQEVATQQLESLGLKVDVTKEYDADIAKGKATRTVPGVGEKAEKGSTVDLYMSRGPKQAAVPNVVGQDVDEATKTLEDAGFKVDTTEEDGSEDQGQVLKQSPAASEQADEGSTIKLTVASGQNDVPDVTGLTESDATSQLKDAGFKVTTSPVDVTDVADDGNVMTETPASGTHPVGSTVKLEIGALVETP